MDATLTSYIAQPSIIAQLLAGTAGIAAMAFAGSFAVPKVMNRMVPKPKTTRLGDHIKFQRLHADRRTIVGEDDVYTTVLHISGTDLRYNEPGRQQALTNARQAWIEQLGELGVRMRVHMIRDRLPKASNYPHDYGIMKQVADTWNKNLPAALSTEYYAVLSIKDKNERRAVDKLSEAIEQSKSILSDYRVTELTQHYDVPDDIEQAVPLNERREERMSPTAFFGRLLSPISRPDKIGERKGKELAYLLTTDNVRYDPNLGMMEFTSGPQRKYAAIFPIEEWASPMNEAHMLEVLSFPIEMMITHDIMPISKGAALATLRWQEKMAPGLNPGSDTPEQFALVAAAIERGAAEEQELCSVQTTITIYGNTPEEVLAGRNRLNELKMIGVTPVWAKHTMVQHWFSQFPGYDSQTRPQRLLSGEAALLTTFQFTPSGKNSSDWGEGPIMSFETLEGAPYAFQFHAGEGSPPLGHCVVIGPSGAGKTTIITALASMALRHPDLKTFFFDRGRGCEVVTHALGGAYLQFDGSAENVGLNPMQLPDSPQNRQFLNNWLQLIAGVDSDDVREQREIAEAVEINYEINERLRNLAQLYKNVFPSNSKLREKMLPWTNDNQFGKIVCAERDSLDISTRVAGFDFTTILEDQQLGPALVSYIMHRILADAKGDPRLIFIDETEPLLRNQGFQHRYRKLLQEGRKERQVIISCFQRPSAPADLGLGDVIRGQCPTIFFFRNPQAQPEDYEDWRLSERELKFIRGETHKRKRYAVLVKRYTEQGESVILDTDLSRLGPLMKIYHSGRKEVELMNRMRAEYGPDALAQYLVAA